MALGRAGDVVALSRRARWRLWVRYALRHHEITGRRVRHLRWDVKVIAGANGPSRPVYRLGAWDRKAGMWVGWEWPG